jgi:hypothetical protein
MKFIKVAETIFNHPKTIRLAEAMGWEIDETVGKLYRFWLWVTNYAEDGNLSKYEPVQLGYAVGLKSAEGKKFVETLIAVRLLDTSPYLRVHDWWDHIGLYLRAKYRRNPEKWEEVRAAYEEKPSGKIPTLKPKEIQPEAKNKGISPENPNSRTGHVQDSLQEDVRVQDTSNTRTEHVQDTFCTPPDKIRLDEIRERQDQAACTIQDVPGAEPDLPPIQVVPPPPPPRTQAGAFVPPTEGEVMAYAKMHPEWPPEECQAFFHYFEGSGWVDKNGIGVRSWRSKLAYWIAQAKQRVIEKNHHSQNGNPGKAQQKQGSHLDREVERMRKEAEKI